MMVMLGTPQIVFYIKNTHTFYKNLLTDLLFQVDKLGTRIIE